MTLGKGEDTLIWRRKVWIALCGELVWKRLWTCRKTDYLNERIYHGVLHFQNVERFHGRGVHVIPCMSTRKIWYFLRKFAQKSQISAGERPAAAPLLPKRMKTTFRAWRKFELKNNIYSACGQHEIHYKKCIMNRYKHFCNCICVFVCALFTIAYIDGNKTKKIVSSAIHNPGYGAAISAHFLPN